MQITLDLASFPYEAAYFFIKKKYIITYSFSTASSKPRCFGKQTKGGNKKKILETGS